MTRPIRVVVVDDSTFIRQFLTAALSADAGIEIVATARDPYEAREKIKATNPDVVTLDVEMPRMDGLSFLEKIMTLRPTPVIMVSSLTREGSEATVRALELGAVDYVEKPIATDRHGFEALKSELIAKVKMAAHARPSRRVERRLQPLATPRRRVAGAIVAIGASTGGVERIRDLLSVLPSDVPPVVITQHMGPSYLASFAARLDSLSALSVALAEPGLRLGPGTAAVAPGNRHLGVIRDRQGYVCRISDGPPVSGHRPSVDVLFQSVAEAAGNDAVGIILSGMGRDGADGLLAMRSAGAATIGESEASCVVYGMPRIARQCGAVAVEVPLSKIAGELMRALDRSGDEQRMARGTQ